MRERREGWTRMKSRRPGRRGRSIWGRVAGYGGAVLLVAAAVAVLLVPLLEDDGGADPAAAGRPADGAPAPSGAPSDAPTRHTEPPATIRTPGATAPDGGGTQGGQGGASGDGGPPMPGELGGGTGTSWCPQGTAAYRATGTGVDVVVAVASSGAVRAELQTRGEAAPRSQQTTIRGGSPHTFRFTGVSPQRVERVKITTVSVGVAMQTCYARAAA
ncbi:hypothetical protein [Actinomadura sp. WMMB 499]|uniref:hypothetical protein n=1 Tax=Actinomadura sp. WMMB 499 TaxID=1219491 RepID=UPI001243E95D|nr:hypothetical protein [Actinomadura sp. WMMB 499]QFG26428.1 hypothetical protein F7P10_40120 [Actinomadura sp. WMMB 499]